VRPVAPTNALNQAPRSWRKATGEVDESLAAVGLSFPRGDSPTPHTTSWLFTAWSASYDAASARPQISADWFWPALFHCGLMNNG
jgi:hypothetical protein